MRSRTSRDFCPIRRNPASTAWALLYGEGATEEEATELESMIRDKFKDLETAVIPGGQPVYSYIISVE